MLVGCGQPKDAVVTKADAEAAATAKKGMRKGADREAKAPTAPKRKSPGPAIGTEAPDIVGKDLDGKEFKLSDYRDQVVVLDFWGDW